MNANQLMSDFENTSPSRSHIISINCNFFKPTATENSSIIFTYVARLITKDISSNPHTEPILKNFKSIEDMFIGEQRCCMTFNPDPIQNYDRIVKWNNGAALTIRSTTGNTTPLNRDTYVNIIDEFSVAVGLKKLQIIEIICERDGEVFSKSVIN